MWPFSSTRTERKPRAWYQELEDRVHVLERNLRELTDEWLDQQQKFSRLYARLAKAAKKQEMDAEAALENAPGATNGEHPSPDPWQTDNPAAAAILGRMRF